MCTRQRQRATAEWSIIQKHMSCFVVFNRVRQRNEFQKPIHHAKIAKIYRTQETQHQAADRNFPMNTGCCFYLLKVRMTWSVRRHYRRSSSSNDSKGNSGSTVTISSSSRRSRSGKRSRGNSSRSSSSTNSRSIGLYKSCIISNDRKVMVKVTVIIVVVIPDVNEEIFL